MLFRINGLQISNLQKSQNPNLIEVDIIANHLTEDEDGETILKQAFDKDTVRNFLDTGIVDYWHDSENEERTKEARNAAVIGKPIAFRWDNGKPIVTAQLTKTHPRVQEMLPHLEAGQPVFAASVYGSKMVLETKDATGQIHKVIPKITWKSLAIAPSPYVVNTGSGMNVKLLKKANDILCEFDNVESFKTNFQVMEKEQELRKALLAPESVSDLRNTPGGAITKQSIEKKPVQFSLSEDEGLDLIDTLLNFKSKKIPKDKDGYIKYFKNINKQDFGSKSYDLISKYFKNKRS